jgi:hypothetical protein
MTKGGRIFGGIFALIGSALTLYFTYFSWTILLDLWVTLLLLIAGACGVLGGILLLCDKTAGGVLAIIAGAITVILVPIYIYPFFGVLMAQAIVVFFSPGMLLIGGIVGTAVGSEI